jgi:hypothetical protein
LGISDVYSLAFSPDGKLILVGSLQGMSLWGYSDEWKFKYLKGIACTWRRVIFSM